MKFQNILLLLTACLLAGSCSDDDNDGAWFLPRAPALDRLPQELAVGDLLDVDRGDDRAHLGPDVE